MSEWWVPLVWFASCAGAYLVGFRDGKHAGSTVALAALNAALRDVQKPSEVSEKRPKE